jgi:putative hydrolase of the HAD superfamily
LLDTSAILIPPAVKRACESMIGAGLQCSLGECLQMRQELSVLHSHTEIFSRILDHYGVRDRDRAMDGALDAFYNPFVPAHLPMLSGALENLEKLKKQYNLYLVTMGSPEGQKKKIKALDIEQHFKKIFIVDSLTGQRKYSAFHEIIREEGHAPAELLSIGNRLSSEIRDGKKAGATTCYFAYGEHVGEKAVEPEDTPDFTIYHHRELIPACGL